MPPSRTPSHGCVRNGAVNRREPTGGSACPNAANQVVRVPRDMRDWVNFASTGNPGWASYDPNTRSTRVYTAEPTTQFWNSMISRRRRSGSMRLGRHPAPGQFCRYACRAVRGRIRRLRATLAHAVTASP
jgi:hypothetical protein